jgi:hypothetical protein
LSIEQGGGCQHENKGREEGKEQEKERKRTRPVGVNSLGAGSLDLIDVELVGSTAREGSVLQKEKRRVSTRDRRDCEKKRRLTSLQACEQELEEYLAALPSISSAPQHSPPVSRPPTE